MGSTGQIIIFRDHDFFHCYLYSTWNFGRAHLADLSLGSRMIANAASRISLENWIHRNPVLNSRNLKSDKPGVKYFSFFSDFARLNFVQLQSDKSTI